MISVAMATYCGGKYLEKQILSILNQTIPVDEIIICDDSSTDDTLNIVNDMRKTTDVKFVIQENPYNLGYIQNFHKAVSLTCGDYIFLCDQDDIWLPNKVETMIDIMNSFGCEVLCTKFDLIDGNDDLIENTENYRMHGIESYGKEYVSKISMFKLIFGNVAPGCTYCFTNNIKKAYLEVKNNDVIHDYQIMLIGGVMGKAFYLNIPTIKYRLHENNSVGIKKKARDTKFVFHKIKKTPIMVDFLNELNKNINVNYLMFFKLIYYFRIPIIKAKIRRMIFE